MVKLSQAIESGEHCFLSSKEWQALLFKSDTWPFQKAQTKSLSLRVEMSKMLADMPSLIKDYSRLKMGKVSLSECADMVDMLIQRASVKYNEVRNWLELELIPVLSSHISAQEGITGPADYPDLIAGVLDCVASTALSALDKILRSALHAKLLQSRSSARRDLHGFASISTLNDPEVWRQRAIRALEFVRAESTIAAKPLESALLLVQHVAPESSAVIATR